MSGGSCQVCIASYPRERRSPRSNGRRCFSLSSTSRRRILASLSETWSTLSGGGGCRLRSNLEAACASRSENAACPTGSSSFGSFDADVGPPKGLGASQPLGPPPVFDSAGSPSGGSKLSKA